MRFTNDDGNMVLVLPDDMPWEEFTRFMEAKGYTVSLNINIVPKQSERNLNGPVL